MHTRPKVVLAFSGGLDTSYCALHLARERGCDVVAVMVNTGGFTTREIADIEARASALGVAAFVCLDEEQTYYTRVLRHLVYGNVLKNGAYPLSVSAERIVQAMAIARYATSIGADAIAHGSTGAGNDQVRFDMVFRTLAPGLEILTPIRDRRLSRAESNAWLAAQGVVVPESTVRYSINKGLWGTSVGGRETLTSDTPLPEEAWPTPVTRTGSEALTLGFVRGEIDAVNGERFARKPDAIRRVQELAAPYGIGRDIHVGDTIIGIKGRVGFEAAAPLLLIKAHHALEKHVSTKWQLFWKDQLAVWYGNWLHEGQFLDPAMRDIEALFESSQRTVTGEVLLTLAPYRFSIDGVRSPHDLMSAEFGSYGEENRAWTGDDVKGFAAVFGNQAAIWRRVNEGLLDEE
ncbi:MAG: argininosuccinate synthase [Ignavibacteriae bacterium]|nr:argininosuccinate synthase [Ignavibacteriota bacterium]